jgi:hypothetical protein
MRRAEELVAVATGEGGWAALGQELQVFAGRDEFHYSSRRSEGNEMGRSAWMAELGWQAKAPNAT